jgi:two-component system, cell cycle sensor histidine kinase and response regulator CckA
MQEKSTLNFSIIPVDDPKQALRLRRFFMASAAYIICAFLCYIAYLTGFVKWEAFVGWAIFATLINVFIFIFLRTGLNLKMADPSLTVLQMCAAIVMVMYVMLYANQSRALWLLIYVIILLFGIFRLNTRGFLYVSLFTLLTYGGVILHLHFYRPQGVNFHMEYLQWVVLAGILVLFSVIGGDISGLRANLSKSRSTIKEMTDSMQDVMFVLDMNLNYTYISPSVEILRGYTTEEVMKQTPLEAMTPSSLELAGRMLSEVMDREKTEHQGDISRTLELEVKRKDGTAVWTETKFTFIRGENQQPLHIVGVMRDITERKKAESQREAMLEEIRRAEEKYRTILENIREAYFEVDLSGNFTFFNDSLCRMTGCSKEELTGTNYAKFSNEENSKIVFRTFNKVYQTGKTTEAFDWPIFTGNGAKGYIEASILLRNDSAGNPIGFKGVLRDVTERKRAEEELQKARDKLVQAEKLSALGQLSIVVAHEILNPLNIISMELQILQALEGMPPEVQEELKICMLQIDRIVAIAEELKQFARSPEQKMEMANINSVIAHVLNIYKSRLRTDEIKTEVKYQQELPEFPMDSKKMEQVILNLISNAGEAMAGRENKVLRMTTDWGEDREQAMIMVADTGSGIQEEYLPKIFDPFFTTKGQGKGTGLGLYISHDIIRAHGGKIWAENNESGGASFYISLPLKRNVDRNHN